MASLGYSCQLDTSEPFMSSTLIPSLISSVCRGVAVTNTWVIEFNSLSWRALSSEKPWLAHTRLVFISTMRQTKIPQRLLSNPDEVTLKYILKGKHLKIIKNTKK